MGSETVTGRTAAVALVERLALRLAQQCISRGIQPEEAVLGLVGAAASAAGGDAGAHAGIDWVRTQLDRAERVLLEQEPEPRIGR